MVMYSLRSFVVHGGVDLLSDMDAVFVFQEVLGRCINLVWI